MRKKSQTTNENLPALRKEIYQGNPLINAKKEFNTLETRIFLLGIRGINPHFSLKDKLYDEKFPELFIPTERLTELLGGNTWYLHDLDKLCDKFFDAKIHLRYEDGGFTIMHIFRRLDYVPDEGLYIQFDEFMRPYLLDLFEAKGYTKINVEQIFYLTSPYALRLVELMLQYQNIPEFKMRQEIIREIDIDRLKFALNVPADAYDGRMSNFRKKVLDDPISEINEKTIYQMSYKVIKQGRKVTGFEFHMDMRAVPIEDERLKYSNNAINQLLKIGFSLASAQEILNACYSEDDCLNRLVTAQKILQKQKKRDKFHVDNELGFIRTAMIENWRPDSKRNTRPPINKPKPISTPRKLFEENRKNKENYISPTINKPKKQEISASIQEMIIDMLDNPQNTKIVESILKSAGWSLAEFKGKYLGGTD